MKEFEQAKQNYESTPLPAQLSRRVEEGIRQGKRAARMRRMRSVGLGTAACLTVLVGTLNLSPTVAAAAADVPVLGGLFQILTVRSYEQDKDQAHYDVTVPALQAEGELARQVNEEIQAMVDRHLTEQQAAWEAYREAFLATGGTEAEWAERDMQVKVDYKVMAQSDTTVSFMVDLSQCSANAFQTHYYYNLDLENDRYLTLADVLGEDWMARCNDAVNAHVQANTDADGGSLFFAPEDGGFTTVDETTAFYINEAGAAVVVFPEYSIAAGAAGIVEVPVA